MASCKEVIRALAEAGVRSRSTCTCMPAVKARPAPVSTAAPTPASRARRSNVSRTAAMSSGVKRLSGGRSRVTHAQRPFRSTRTRSNYSALASPPIHSALASGLRPSARTAACGINPALVSRLHRSPRTAGSVSARTSVPAHRGIDASRPGVETARQVLHVAEAETPQVLGHGGAAHSLVAVHDDLVAGVELVGPELDLLDGNVDGVLQPAELGLPVLAHVEEHERGALVQARLEFGRRQLVGHEIKPPGPEHITGRAARRGGGRTSRETPRS